MDSVIVTRPANRDCGACYNVCIEAHERDRRRLPFWIAEVPIDVHGLEVHGCALHTSGSVQRSSGLIAACELVPTTAW